MSRMPKNHRNVCRMLKETTGWTYTFCHMLVSTLGYVCVKRAIMDSNDTKELVGILNKEWRLIDPFFVGIVLRSKVEPRIDEERK